MPVRHDVDRVPAPRQQADGDALIDDVVLGQQDARRPTARLIRWTGPLLNRRP